MERADRIVDAINRAGLGIIARLDNQPDWARRDKIFPASACPISWKTGRTSSSSSRSGTRARS